MATVSAYKSDIGRNPKRQNEDYIWVDEQAGLYIVADGMGGQEAGEVASELASNTVGDLISQPLKGKTDRLSREEIETLMIGAIETANETVAKAAKAADQKRKMGATIVVALLHRSKAYISHAGDARAYLIRGSTIMQLTKDDSWSEELAAEGLLPKEKVKDHVYSHIVTKAIGQGSLLAPSFTELALTPGDWLLLCSDGLWNMVSDEDILEIIQQAAGDSTRVVEDLVAAANEAGGKDNISIVVVNAVAA
jgi:protein phosphatase